MRRKSSTFTCRRSRGQTAAAHRAHPRRRLACGEQIPVSRGRDGAQRLCGGERGVSFQPESHLPSADSRLSGRHPLAAGACEAIQLRHRSPRCCRRFRGGHLSALVGTSGGKKAFPAIGGHLDQSDRVQAVIDIFGPADFSTVVQQAAEDKNVKNIFAFNTPSDPYSPHRHQARRQTESRCREPRALRQQRQLRPSSSCTARGTHDMLVPYAQSVQFEAALNPAQGVL
jgi:hypothetical protein